MGTRDELGASRHRTRYCLIGLIVVIDLGAAYIVPPDSVLIEAAP